MYFQLGQLAAMCLVQGGGGFHLLCRSVFCYFSGVWVSDIIADVSEVPRCDVRELLEKVGL